MASTPFSNIALPQEVTNPLYTSSQSALNNIGTNLLSGTPLPGAYADLGQPDSPAFQAMLNSVKGQIMQGSQESSAISGTGRSGVAQTASNNALNQVLPQLTYQDFLNSQQQQQSLLGAGISTEQGVGQSAQNQQQFDTNFNQTLFGDQDLLANQINQYKQQAAGSIGSAIGTGVGAIGGGLLGLTLGPVGGLVGAAAGAGLGSSIAGGTSNNTNNISSLSNLFNNLSSQNSPNSASYGISSQLGSFNNGLSSYNASGLSSILSEDPDFISLTQ